MIKTGIIFVASGAGLYLLRWRPLPTIGTVLAIMGLAMLLLRLGTEVG